MQLYGDVVALARALGKAIPKKRRTKALDFLQLRRKVCGSVLILRHFVYYLFYDL